MSDVSLGTVGLTIAGWFAGFLSALVLDRRRNTRRLRALATALLEEVRRIRGELGNVGGFSDIQIAGAVSVAPEVHPWVERLMGDVAEIDPEAFAQFLALDRFLGNARPVPEQRATRA